MICTALTINKDFNTEEVSIVTIPGHIILSLSEK